MERLILPEINSRIDEELDGTGPLSYKQVTQEQHDEAVTKCLEFLAADVLESGEAYLDKWERGWGENLAEFESLGLGEEALTAIAPKFVRKGSPVKLRGKWIMPNHPNFERDWSRGYFAKLEGLQKSGEIEILEQGRTFGSFYHEGYTMTVWRPRINSSTTRTSC